MVAEGAAQHGQCRLQRDQVGALLPLRLGLGLGAAHDGRDGGQDEHPVGVAAEAGGPRLHVDIVEARLLDVPEAHEDGVGPLGGEVAAVLGGASLEDHRLALAGAGDIERPLHRQELALVVQGVELRRVEEDAAFLVIDERVVLPAVPKTLRHVQVFGRQAVADVVGEMLLLAEVRGRAFEPRRHHVPAHPAAGYVIQRGELAGHVEGLRVGDAQRRHQPDALGDRGQGREDRDRLEAVQVVRARFLIDGQAVGDEQEVELAALGGLRSVAVIAEVGAGARLGVGVAPVGPGAPCALDHVSQLQLPARRHCGVPIRGVPAQNLPDDLRHMSGWNNGNCRIGPMSAANFWSSS